MNRQRNNVATLAEARTLARARGINISAAFTAVRAREDGETSTPADYAELRARTFAAAGTTPARSRTAQPIDTRWLKEQALAMMEIRRQSTDPKHATFAAAGTTPARSRTAQPIDTRWLKEQALAMMEIRRQSTDPKHATFAENYKKTILELSK